MNFSFKKIRVAYLDSSACICKAMALDCDISETSEIIGPPVIALLVEQDAVSVDGWIKVKKRFVFLNSTLRPTYTHFFNA